MSSRSSFKKSVQNWLKRSLEDPITKILAKNSNLTITQLETLLIDVLAENVASKPLKYDEKAKLRLTRTEISRGSFNRTLRQAKSNCIKSIYTLLLLGYLSILENTSLTPYLEAANKLKTYREAYQDLLTDPKRSEEQLQIIHLLREDLEATFNQLTKPWASSNS